MCLDSIDTKLPTVKEGVGWKVFKYKSASSRLYGPSYTRVSEGYEIEKWYMDVEAYGIEYPPTGINYPRGFHIFLNKDAAEKWRTNHCGIIHEHVIRKVEYRRAVA